MQERNFQARKEISSITFICQYFLSPYLQTMFSCAVVIADATIFVSVFSEKVNTPTSLQIPKIKDNRKVG